jgi:hypothetical protein
MKRAILTALAIAVLSAPAATASSEPQARPVTLRDARVAPSYLHLVQPGRSVTRTHQCDRGGYWTELSAYQWNGEALPAQRWNADHDRMSWGRVTFDGITFRNHYSQPVIVAGWCE